MVREEFLQTMIIESHDAEEVTKRLNQVLKEYSALDVTYTKTYYPEIGHCAHVEWREVTIIPENARDEFQIKGITHYCGECPKFHLSEDKRVKYSFCEKGQKVWYDREACSARYEEIKREEG